MIGDGVQGAARAIEEMDLLDQTKLFSLSYSEEAVNLLRRVLHRFRRDAFGQGHDPIIHLYNCLVAKEIPESSTYTRTEVIDKFSISGL